MSSTAIDLLAPVHRLTVDEYHRIAETGVFDGGPRVELIDGVVVEMSPQGRPHAKAIAWLNDAIVRQLGPEHIAMPQLPAPMPAQDSTPEPDLWVCERARLRVEDASPLLVIEIAVSSLDYDRTTKARIYARRGIREYWVINLADAVVEVHRDPAGSSWRTVTTHASGAVLHPVLLPTVAVDVSALLDFVSA